MVKEKNGESLFLSATSPLSPSLRTDFFANGMSYSPSQPKLSISSYYLWSFLLWRYHHDSQSHSLSPSIVHFHLVQHVRFRLHFGLFASHLHRRLTGRSDDLCKVEAKLFVQLALTATFFAGVFQASLGFLRLGFIVDFLLHATIVGFIGGAATVVCLQQLKGTPGFVHFTHEMDVVAVLKSVFSQTHQTTVKTGIITGVIGLAGGITVGRSFSMFRNYHVNGNKEIIAFGLMNIAGSCTYYLTTGPFSRIAVNFNAGCKLAVSNIVMATTVMITLLFLTPLFKFTPLIVLSIIISAMLGLIDYEAAIHLWKVDKFDFCVCIAAYIGVIFEKQQKHF